MPCMKPEYIYPMAVDEARYRRMWNRERQFYNYQKSLITGKIELKFSCTYVFLYGNMSIPTMVRAALRLPNESTITLLPASIEGCRFRIWRKIPVLLRSGAPCTGEPQGVAYRARSFEEVIPLVEMITLDQVAKYEDHVDTGDLMRNFYLGDVTIKVTIDEGKQYLIKGLTSIWYGNLEELEEETTQLGTAC